MSDIKSTPNCAADVAKIGNQTASGRFFDWRKCRVRIRRSAFVIIPPYRYFCFKEGSRRIIFYITCNSTME